ncbi:MAG: hypothetical protein ABI562_04605 [Chloroflexota bacterium]
METRYDVEPRPLGRSSRRRAWIVVVAAAIFLAAVLVKPWNGGPAKSSPAAIAETPRPTASTRLVEAAVAPFEAAPRATPIWPAGSSPSAATNGTALQAEGGLGALASRSGTWGVGDAGVGPRLLRDEPWTDWVQVAPEAADRGPIHVAIRPETDPCAGFPTIYDSPSLVAVTAPGDLAPDWRLAGWWTDGGQVEPLAGSVRQVSPAGNRGISYLERTDREAWPPGRYEFHVIVGDSALSMTVCLTRRG